MPRGGKREGAGRKKGSSNQTRKDLLADLQSHKGLENYDPVLAMAYVGAIGMSRDEYETYETILDMLGSLRSKQATKIRDFINGRIINARVSNEDLRMTANREVSQYCYSKRKSIELSDPDGNNPFNTFAAALSESLVRKGSPG